MSDAKPVFMPDLSFNPQADITVRAIGQENQPLLIIDNALARPDDMVEIARRVPFRPPARSMYPGLNAPLPPIYFREMLKFVRPLLGDIFGIAPDAQLSAHGFFALATQSPNELHAIQKIPHQDAADPLRLGMVHYLCRGKQGGTGFFRHIATGFESIDADRREVFAPIALRELEEMKAGLTRHVTGDTPNYQMTGFSEAVFNRLIIYRANVLHSGLLEESALSDDPATGRLTVNSFVGEGPPE